MKRAMKSDHARANHFNQSPSANGVHRAIDGWAVVRQRNLHAISECNVSKFLTYRRTLAKNFAQAFESHLFK
jgi:hypothetical protein